MYIDGNDSISRKTNSRALSKKKSSFCPKNSGPSLQSIPEDIDDLQIFKDDP